MREKAADDDFVIFHAAQPCAAGDVGFALMTAWCDDTRMHRSLYITTMSALPGWPVVERLAHEIGKEPAYDGQLGAQQRATATIQVTLAGRGEAAETLVEVGSALIMDGGAHPDLRYHAVRSWEFFYVNLLGAQSQITSLVAARGHVVSFPHRHPLLRRWLGELPEHGHEHRTLTFQESHRLAADLLALLTASPDPANGLVQRALDVMAGGWDRNLGLGEVARHLGVSVAHLSRVFHAATGQTPAAWYRQHRLERARELLRTSGLSIQEIADRCGFISATYFITCFRANVGMTPARWRSGMHPRG